MVKTIRTRVNEEKPVKFSQLERQLKEKPDDADLNARMAYEHFARRDYKEARPFADKALELKPHHPLASYVKARLLVTIGDDDAALAILEPALDPKQPNERVIDLLAELKMKAGTARRGREALRAGPQGRPVSHQVDRRAGPGPPAAEEHGQVPERPGDDRRQRRRRHRGAQGSRRAAPGRRRRRGSREMGRASACTSTSTTRRSTSSWPMPRPPGKKFAEAIEEYQTALELKAKKPNDLKVKLAKAQLAWASATPPRPRSTASSRPTRSTRRPRHCASRSITRPAAEAAGLFLTRVQEALAV